MASLKSPSLVLDASAVVRIIEGSPQVAASQQSVLDADLLLALELVLTEHTLVTSEELSPEPRTLH